MVNQEEMLSVLLAYSETWQELVGAADPTEALLAINAYQAEDAGDEAKPYPRAIVEETEKERSAAGTGTWRGRGSLLLSIEAEPPDDECESVETQRAWFVALLNDIESELRVLSHSRGTPAGYSVSHFQIKTIAYSVEPFLMPDEDREDLDTGTDTPRKPLWVCQFRVDY